MIIVLAREAYSAKDQRQHEGLVQLWGEALSLAVLMAAVVAFLDRPALMRWTPAVVATGVCI